MKITDNIIEKVATDVSAKVTTSVDERMDKLLMEYSNTPSRKDTSKTVLAIQDIKDVFICKDKNKYEPTRITNSIYEETNAFYKKHLKTSVFKSILNKVNSRVIDQSTLNIVSADPQEMEIIKLVTKEQLKKEELDSLFIAGVLNDRINIKINIKNGNIKLEALYNHNVKKKYKNENEEVEYIDFLYGKKIERRYKDKIQYIVIDEKDHKEKILKTDTHKKDSFLFYSYEFDAKIVSNGLLELMLLYSEDFTAVQKEIKVGVIQNFIDQQYLLDKENYREHIVPVDTPNTATSVGEGKKPLFEFVNPTLKSGDYNTYKEIIKEEISSIMQMDRSLLGFGEQTATGTKVASGLTVDTINRLKREYEKVINTFLSQFIKDVSYSYKLKDFQIKNEEVLYNNISKAVQGGFMTIKEAVKRRSPELGEDDLNKEYLTIMYQKGIPFTVEEEEVAVKLGILSKKEGLDGTVL